MDVSERVKGHCINFVFYSTHLANPLLSFLDFFFFGLLLLNGLLVEDIVFEHCAVSSSDGFLWRSSPLERTLSESLLFQLFLLQLSCEDERDRSLRIKQELANLFPIELFLHIKARIDRLHP